MAKALKIRILNLRLKFPAHTLIFFRALNPAGAVTSRAFQSVPDGLNDLLIRIKPYSHKLTLPLI